MRLLYYLHGFNSAIPDDLSDNPKLLELQRFCDGNDYELVLNSIDYQNIQEEIDSLVEQVSNPEVTEVVFVGTSLGGWFARIVQLNCAEMHNPNKLIYAVAFNPSVNTGVSLREYANISHENYVTGESTYWTMADCDMLSLAENEVDFETPMPFFVFVDKGDEVIPWASSLDEYDHISLFKSWEGGNHRFDHITESLNVFVEKSQHFTIL